MIVQALFDSGNGSYFKSAQKFEEIEIYSIGLDIENKNDHFINLNLADYSYLFKDNTLFDTLDKLPKPDLIIASPPCESWSVASAMRGGNACWKQEDGGEEMITSTFKDVEGKELEIVMNTTNIVFNSAKDFDGFAISYEFDDETFRELRKTLSNFANKVWASFTPKAATSEGSDYYEYYDRNFDNNGYLSCRDYWLSFDRPVKSNLKLYQLNKRKAESLIFDLYKD